jgi:hypothetical protein
MILDSLKPIDPKTLSDSKRRGTVIQMGVEGERRGTTAERQERELKYLGISCTLL